MSFERGRHAAAGWGLSSGTGQGSARQNFRRAFLEMLSRAANDHRNLASGVVEQRGTPITNVIRVDPVAVRGMSADIAADLLAGEWWFVWAKNGERLAPCTQIDRAVTVLANELGSGL
ncbi:hypothetical protein [Actinomadura sp. 6N118]|uniref:hypothetical protein n=1 Tax=Actinomadura sp. 6N118 TaxID=3375151 RepID=UPI0037BACE62